MRRSILEVLLVGAATVALPAATHATPGTHVVTGVVELHDGRWFGIDGSSDATGDLRGRAWIASDVLPVPAVDIALDCINVSWQGPIYPVPPYLPFHVIQASGVGTDGGRYFITAYDGVAQPVAFGDFAAVTLERADGACGADPDFAFPIHTGDITVLP